LAVDFLVMRCPFRLKDLSSATALLGPVVQLWKHGPERRVTLL
jgi:hypothetical protein